MMAGEKDTDDEDAWGTNLGEEVAGGSDSDAADAWASVVGEGDSGVLDDGDSERVLNQEEIDRLLGFDFSDQIDSYVSGVKALVNSGLVSYERLPMLEIVFDRLVRLTTTSLRNFTSDNVDVSMDSISSVRFGDYLNSVPLPAILSVFKAVEWDNYGLMVVDSPLIYSVIDVLLGGRRGSSIARIEGRPYTTIETNLSQRVVELVLGDAQKAFEPITQVSFELDRLETNPRFAAITRSANAAILVELRVDMDDRGGKIEILLPYATIEPIREQLLQMFMGERFGRDPIWEGHLATEIFRADVDIDAVLHEMSVPISKVYNLNVGDTLMFDRGPDDPISLRCGDVDLCHAAMGHVDKNISVRSLEALRPPTVTMAVFEAIEDEAV